MFTDSSGFLGIPGGPIIVDPKLNLDLVHLTASPPWADTMEKVETEIRKFREEIEKQEKLRILSCGNNLYNTPEDKTAVVLGLQHMPEDANPKLLRELGIRIIIPSYEGWKNNVGLTDEGRRFIINCDELGICIDVSHTNHENAKDILNFSKMIDVKIPVIASHTGCNSVYEHERNLPDDVLKQIAEQGGIVGIYAICFFLDENDKSLNPMFRHLTKAINVCGSDSVCIGSDIPYLCRDEKEWKKSAKKLQARVKPDKKTSSGWPDYPKELNSVDKAVVIKTGFTRNFLSITPDILGKILGLNFYRFVKENL